MYHFLLLVNLKVWSMTWIRVIFLFIDGSYFILFLVWILSDSCRIHIAKATVTMVAIAFWISICWSSAIILCQQILNHLCQISDLFLKHLYAFSLKFHQVFRCWRGFRLLNYFRVIKILFLRLTILLICLCLPNVLTFVKI